MSEYDSNTIGEFVAMLQKYPQNKQILFEDGQGRLFGLFTFRERPSDEIKCHLTVELTELDKETTLKGCE